MIPTLIDLLITKSISHMKPSLQEKGQEAVWCIVEKTEEYEAIADCVCKTFSNSNVKVWIQKVLQMLPILKLKFYRQRLQVWILWHI